MKILMTHRKFQESEDLQMGPDKRIAIEYNSWTEPTWTVFR